MCNAGAIYGEANVLNNIISCRGMCSKANDADIITRDIPTNRSTDAGRSYDSSSDMNCGECCVYGESGKRRCQQMSKRIGLVFVPGSEKIPIIPKPRDRIYNGQSGIFERNKNHGKSIYVAARTAAARISATGATNEKIKKGSSAAWDQSVCGLDDEQGQEQEEDSKCHQRETEKGEKEEKDDERSDGPEDGSTDNAEDGEGDADDDDDDDDDHGDDSSDDDIRDPGLLARVCCVHCQALSGCGGMMLALCARCERVFYCSRECQVEHWRLGGHKQECTPVSLQPLDEQRQQLLSRHKRQRQRKLGRRQPALQGHQQQLMLREDETALRDHCDGGSCCDGSRAGSSPSSSSSIPPSSSSLASSSASQPQGEFRLPFIARRVKKVVDDESRGGATTNLFGLVVAHTPAVSVELRQDKDADNGAGARASEAATCKDKQPNNQQQLQLEELFKVRYEDGVDEDLTSTELSAILVPSSRRKSSGSGENGGHREVEASVNGRQPIAVASVRGGCIDFDAHGSYDSSRLSEITVPIGAYDKDGDDKADPSPEEVDDALYETKHLLDPASSMLAVLHCLNDPLAPQHIKDKLARQYSIAREPPAARDAAESRKDTYKAGSWQWQF